MNMVTIEGATLEPTQSVQQVTPMGAGVPATAESNDPILSAILAAARDPQVDIEKFRALKAMYDEERAYHEERDFNEAFAQAQAGMRPVVKDKRNTHTKSDYATIEAIANAITPIYTALGFSMSFGEFEAKKPNHLGITCRLSRGGISRDYQSEVPIDDGGIRGNSNKTPTHAHGSTKTYGRRYLKLDVWDIATTDDDGNAAGGLAPVETVTPEQAQTLRDLVGAIGRTEDSLIDGRINPDHRKQKLTPITTLDELPASAFEGLVKFLGEMKQKEDAANAG